MKYGKQINQMNNNNSEYNDNDINTNNNNSIIKKNQLKNIFKL